jgi:hypothetical protein
VAPRSLEIGRIYHGLPWECTMVRAEEIVHANIASASSEIWATLKLPSRISFS